MKRSIILFLSLVFLLFSGRQALADRSLERPEILQILQCLTANPRTTWISSGTIEAIHEEYLAPKILDSAEIDRKIAQAQQEYTSQANKPEADADLQKMKLDAIPFNVRYQYSNESKMTSKVIIRYDGAKFYWDIDVLSRTDTIHPPLDDSFMYEYFNLEGNRKRVFAWDGGKYTRYSRDVNLSQVTEAVGDIPVEVNGALTAGLIPWGYGDYSYQSLSAASTLTGVENNQNGHTQISLDIVDSQGKEFALALDPSKDYAVLSCSVMTPDKTIVTYSYDNYQRISNRWNPMTMTIEKISSAASDAGRLLAKDTWQFNSISTDAPSPNGFRVEYAEDALIAYRSPFTDKPVQYLFSSPQAINNQVDSDMLLDLKLGIAANNGSNNCATAAMKYMTAKLACPLTDAQLSPLISHPDQSTSFYALKQFSGNHGLYSKAVVTNIADLKKMTDCQILLYFPGKNHYAAVGNIDDKYIRMVDLTKDKFYYRIDLTQFHLDWEGGVALILSRSPIQIPVGTTEIEDSTLYNIKGAACTTGYYSCTNLLQEYYVIFCMQSCIGLYHIFEERWGCICDVSGSCQNTTMLRYSTSPCIESMGGGCTITGEWTHYYMRACL